MKRFWLFLTHDTAVRPKTVTLRDLATVTQNLSIPNYVCVNITYIFSDIIDTTLPTTVQVKLFF